MTVRIIMNMEAQIYTIPAEYCKFHQQFRRFVCWTLVQEKSSLNSVKYCLILITCILKNP
jgi:hypothetical protein